MILNQEEQGLDGNTKRLQGQKFKGRSWLFCRARAGRAPVTEWTSCWNTLRSCPVHLGHQGGFPPLQSAPLQVAPSPSLSLFTCVDAAVPLTSLATIALRVRERGSWDGGGFSVESVATRICREGGARVTTNLLVRDMDLRPPNIIDSRRLEVVADGLPLFRGVQLAVDTTLSLSAL